MQTDPTQTGPTQTDPSRPRPPPSPSQPVAKPLTGRQAALMEQAKALEAGFLAEMLNHAGLRGAEGAFAGGVGEAQFSSFLRQEQARLMVDKGGIGLAQQIFDSLLRRGAVPEEPHAQD